MGPISIKKDSFDFLKDLAANNNREWFNGCKDRYTEARSNIVSFADALLTEMNRHDHIETASGRQSVFRIYKDVRFSRDKTPYNSHWSGSFKRATKKLRGGYYFRIQPGNSMAAGGFFNPETNDLKRIRQDIDVNYEDWQELLAGKQLTTTFGELGGEQLSTAPRGYAKDHPAISLLRHKQFILRHRFTDEEVCRPDFLNLVNGAFKDLRPFFDHMSGILTTDANGVPII